MRTRVLQSEPDPGPTASHEHDDGPARRSKNALHTWTFPLGRRAARRADKRPGRWTIHVRGLRSL